MKVLLVFLVLELTAVAVVDCFQCYSCSNCNDPFDDSFVNKVNCYTGQCVKTKGTSGKVQVVYRGCSDVPTDNKCEKVSISDVDAEVCYCDTELCNGTSAVGTPLKLLLLLAVVVKITLLAL